MNRKIKSPLVIGAVLFALTSCSAVVPQNGADVLQNFDQGQVMELQPYSLSDFMTFDEAMEFPHQQIVLGTIVKFHEPVRGSFEGEFDVYWVPVEMRVQHAVPAFAYENFTFRVLLNFENDVRLEELYVGDDLAYFGNFATQGDGGVFAGTPGWVYKLDEVGGMTPVDGPEGAEGGNLFDVAESLGFVDLEAIKNSLGK